MRIGGGVCDLVAFVMQLSFSRAWALVWAKRRHRLAVLSVHNAVLTRLDGVPATVRIDNEKTAVVAGAAGGGRNPVVIGHVVGIHVVDDVITDGIIDVRKLDPLARWNYLQYARLDLDNHFTMHPPDGDPRLRSR